MAENVATFDDGRMHDIMLQLFHRIFSMNVSIVIHKQLSHVYYAGVIYDTEPNNVSPFN